MNYVALQTPTIRQLGQRLDDEKLRVCFSLHRSRPSQHTGTSIIPSVGIMNATRFWHIDEDGIMMFVIGSPRMIYQILNNCNLRAICDRHIYQRLPYFILVRSLCILATLTVLALFRLLALDQPTMLCLPQHFSNIDMSPCSNTPLTFSSILYKNYVASP